MRRAPLAIGTFQELFLPAASFKQTPAVKLTAPADKSAKVASRVMVISDLLHGLAFAHPTIDLFKEKLGTALQETGSIKGGDVFYGEADGQNARKGRGQMPTQAVTIDGD